MIEEPNYEFALYLGVQLDKWKVKGISCCAQDKCVLATQSVKQHRCDKKASYGSEIDLGGE